jgi:hypothetical protein
MQEPIVLKAYELLKFTLPLINRLPKNQKFTYGDRLQNHLTDLLEQLLEAFYSPPDAKRPLLMRINIRLEKLRFLFRLGFETGLFDSGMYRELSSRTDEIGRMCGGWLRAIK